MIAATSGTIWNFSHNYTYLKNDHDHQIDSSWEANKLLFWIKTGGTWLLLFSNFVPISLLMTLEIVKFFQGIFMEWEHYMYHIEMDQPAVVQACNLNEELGQIEYIFTDKTGTLTCNQMVFRKFSAGKISYNTATNTNTEDQQSLLKVLKHIVLCHTVVIDSKSGEYNSASPDELALLIGAKELGALFHSKDEDNLITISIPSQENRLNFKLVSVLEFSSARKRMSVIV